jgi:hypothetical protein
VKIKLLCLSPLRSPAAGVRSVVVVALLCRIVVERILVTLNRGVRRFQFPEKRRKNVCFVMLSK